VFDNRELRRIFGSRGEEVEGRWREPRNEKLHRFESSHGIHIMIH
jgi:hypothetical protein